MSEKRVQFNQIVKNQLPSYVREEFPLIGEFLSQYYRGQEYQGGPIDLVTNIDSYIKLNECANTVGFTSLTSDIGFTSTTINVENTSGFPNSYGLLKINDEIVTYTGITTNSFTGCIRGFSGITSFRNPDVPEDLVFSTSESADHSESSRVVNLSSLFLDEFLKKLKRQYLPGIENRDLAESLNDAEFIRHSRDFYTTRGTDVSFKILFKALYGVDVEVIRPRDYVISASNANFRKQRSIIVEAISGDPLDLVNNTLFQDPFENIPRASSPVANVERITVGVLTDSYYRLGIDGSYIQNTGTSDLLYDQFSVHAKTKSIGEVGVGQSFIIVDSTLGFPQTGSLTFTYENTTVGIVTYSSKTVNQFLGVVGIDATIADGTDIDQNTYAYSAGLGRTDGIRVKIRSVLNDLEIPNVTYSQKAGSRVKIKSLGRIAENDVRANNWLFNTAPFYEVESMTLIDAVNGTYRLNTKDINLLRIGDNLSLTDNESQKIFGFVVQEIFNETTCLIRGFGVSNPDQIIRVTRELSKCDSDLHTNLNDITANVQNVYIDSTSGKNLVASPSLPAFAGFKLNPKLQKYTFSGTFISGNDTFKITDRVDHNYFTGDAIYYTPEKDSEGNVVSSLGFSEGLYFVKRVDENNIKLAKSPSNLYNNIFATVSLSIVEVTINNHTVEKYDFKGRIIKPQKLLRELSNPVVDIQRTETPAGYTGILINGVEILNYKSRNDLYFGRIEKIDVVSGGRNYDVVSPPTLRIKDINEEGFTVGSGATGFPSIRGKFEEIRVLDSGFDYIDVPTIKISGGNPIRPATAQAKLVTVPHEVIFNSTGIGSIGIGSTSTIGRVGFSTHHKFRNGERVTYKTFGRKALSGLSTDAVYHVSVVDPQTIKLHKNLNDVITGINTVVIDDYGIGNHAFVSLNGKAILNSVVITDSGEGYQTKKRTCGTVGIITALNTINIVDHEYRNGEIITYSVDGTSVTGLSTEKQYYVTVVDKDNFKLSVAGVGTTSADFYYLTKQYENLTGVGIGTHTFNYPNINVEVIGSVGISSIEGKNFNAVLQPIVRGEITSIHLSNKGVGYGSSEVINLQRWPEIDFLSGQDAEIKAIVDPRTGKIIDVVIDNAGFGYSSPPRLIVKDTGSGTGALLVPEIGPGQDSGGRPLSGTIKSIKINQAGIGYGVSTTTVIVESAGSGSQFSFELQSWKVNEVQKNLTNLTEDDVFLSRGTNIENELQCSYAYAPRKLRQSIYATDQGGKILYGKKDLTLVAGIEQTQNDNHSPIIGWSYDGHPIYGPFGYATKSGGVVTQLKSGYSLNLKPNRPPLSVFPEGFFVEDYTWTNSTDEAVLDENNGRFCVTPDYPNGTYAYFATFDLTPASDGIFKNFKAPAFPYLIGKYYNSKPNQFNFRKKSNQDDIDLNNTNWIRNTYPYVLRGNKSGYEYVNQSYKYVNQDSVIKHVKKGSVDFIGIVTGGSNYKINDRIIFEQDPSDGFFAAAKVSRVLGVGVGTLSVANTRLTGLEFYPSGNTNTGEFIGVYTGNHGFINQDILTISGLSTTSSFLEGSYRVGVSTSKFKLNREVSSSTSTGIVTYFSLLGNLSPDKLEVNDLLRIDSEDVKVLNIDRVSSRVRVLRANNGTVSAAHTIFSEVSQLPRKFSFSVGYNTSFSAKRNREYYFNPIESVGLGSETGVGVGITLSFANPGVGITQYFVQTRSLYLPAHGFETGDAITYHTNGGDTIGVSTIGGGSSIPLTNNSPLYVAKLNEDNIGLSTVIVGLGTTGTFVGIASTTAHQGLLHFVGLGTGTIHSFKISHPTTVTGNVEKNLVTVSTAATHGLFNGDTVFVDVNPGLTTTVYIKYNKPNRKLVTTGIAFTSGNVTTSTSTINISDHNLLSGQKIIHVADSPSGGLESDKEYYVYVVDRNNIKLSNTKYNALKKKPEIISISSASSGTILPVNPPIRVYKDSTLNFDLSDLSLSYDQSGLRYPAFKFELYTDSKFKNAYETNGTNSNFDVTRSGTVGVTADAKVTVSINQSTPKVLYYRLLPLNSPENPGINKEIVNDSTVDLNNELISEKSVYSGEFDIIKTSANTFTYGLSKYPEKNNYSSTNSTIEYQTDSLSAYGAITRTILSDRGKGYTKVPGITSVRSDLGNGAILEASSKTIGKIEKVTIQNIGFDYPADKTLSPDTKIPQVLRIEQLAGFSRVGVTSFGRNYSVEPKLVVIDGRTKKPIDDIDIRYEFNKETLNLVRNTFSLSNITPTILPVQNSNGIRVSNMSFDSSTKDVTVTLRDSFSVNFPFAVNDKILVENTSVGVGSTGLGYNSANYDYTLFTVTQVHPNLGGIGIVTFSMASVLGDGETPGFYDTGNSSGIIVPSQYFPQFDPTLRTFEFRQLDNVTDGKSQGTVYTLDTESKYLVVESDDDFEVGTELQSTITGAKGLVTERIAFDSRYNLDFFSVTENGWEYTTGFLNNQLQKIHDNEYYQNFSYSIKSPIPYEKWNNVVSRVNHTSGFKKFSDLQVESTPSVKLTPTSIDGTSITVKLDSLYDLNSYFNYDLVHENYLTNGEVSFSDEINFTTRILTDYTESISNRVLRVDDISYLFNSEPRSTPFGEVFRRTLAESRLQKYITYVKDRLFTQERQVLMVTTLSDTIRGLSMINQYGRLESVLDLGSFDSVIEGSDSVLRFYPTKFRLNNYNVITLSYSMDQIEDALSSIGSTTIGQSTGFNGSLVSLASSSVSVGGGSTVTIATLSGIGTTASNFRSAKILVLAETSDDQIVYDELNLIHDNSEIELLQYGQLSIHSQDEFSATGLGTYNAYLSGSDIILSFDSDPGITTTIINTVTIGIATESYLGIGTINLAFGSLTAKSTSISASGSPSAVGIASFANEFDGGYCLLQVSDTTNNRHQLSEVIFMDDDDDVYLTEYGNIETFSSLGTVGAERVGDRTEITFTPISGIDVHVKTFLHTLRDTEASDISENVELNNISVEDGFNVYTGTEVEVKRDFFLTHKDEPIFLRVFDGSNSNVVDLSDNSIFIPNHYFVSGEEVNYSCTTGFSTNAIGIAATAIPGLGSTDKLPETAYVIKIDEKKIQLAATAENSLRVNPIALQFTSVGIGTSHVITSTKQNNKVLISIDNQIQSPIVGTSVTTTLSDNFSISQDIAFFTGITSFFGGDSVKIGNEIMKIQGVGIGSTNAIKLTRSLAGTSLVGHSSGATVTKLRGDYNIVGSTLNFLDAPFGRSPIGTSFGPTDRRDFTGISSSSSFSGRTFMRSGVVGSSTETYSKNYIFDDISQNFSGSRDTYTLTSENTNIVGISTFNGILLINGIFQGPGVTRDYTLSENSGITSVTFTGTASTTAYDPNDLDVPIGGVIVSVAGTTGFGYQPLVSAGGTAVVSSAGTIQSISIGNSGSGYRSGIQTTVNVSVATSSRGVMNLTSIGTAAISGGHIVSIAVTNPGIGYTSTNPPKVIIDAPLPYSHISLQYSNDSVGSGGTGAKVSITVGQGSSVIDFTLTNTGYGYGLNHILTIPTGGATGIPTTPVGNDFKEFQLEITDIITDSFSGWTLGEIEPLDDFSNLFDGKRKTFPITRSGSQLSLQSDLGSLVNIEDVLLVFINDVLQVPGVSYFFIENRRGPFGGGSNITFEEAPKTGDTLKFLFYRGTSGTDVLDKDVTTTVKTGDNLTIGWHPTLGQKSFQKQTTRVVTELNSSSSSSTNVYYGPGLSENSILYRPVAWRKQTEDKIINGNYVYKNRELYESEIYPTANIIKTVGIGSTVVFVDSVRPFFNPLNESAISLDFQRDITLVNYSIDKVGAAATVHVTDSGGIENFVISNGGIGYTSTNPPEIVIGTPVGFGTTARATATATVSIGGSISAISVGSTVGFGYTNQVSPIILIAPPTITEEKNTIVSYEGDFGIITGIGTTSTSEAPLGLVLDLVIPENSVLRDSNITTYTSTSGIQTGYYFCVFNSNVGTGVTSLDETNNPETGIIGIGTTFIDNVYRAAAVSTATTSAIGFGVTTVTRVTVSISTNTTLPTGLGFSNFYGEYSWGKVQLSERNRFYNYEARTRTGYSGIGTGPYIRRTNRLRYQDYST